MKKKIKIFAGGQNVFFKKAIASSIMPISIDLHVKYPFYIKWNKQKSNIFSPWNFHMVLGEQIVISYHIFKSESSKNILKCPQLTRVCK